MLTTLWQASGEYGLGLFVSLSTTGKSLELFFFSSFFLLVGSGDWWNALLNNCQVTSNSENGY